MFGIARVCDGGRLKLVMRGWSAFEVTMRAAHFRGSASPMEASAMAVHVYVEIKLRLIGLLVR